jgi:hypothetical protein
MFRKKRLFILIPTLLLIPLLVGMVPMKLANKMARGGTCEQSEGKQGCSCHKNCPAHSLISQNHFDGIAVPSAAPEQGLLYLEKLYFPESEFFHCQVGFTSIPLRC